MLSVYPYLTIIIESNKRYTYFFIPLKSKIDLGQKKISQVIASQIHYNGKKSVCKKSESKRTKEQKDIKKYLRCELCQSPALIFV